MAGDAAMAEGAVAFWTLVLTVTVMWVLFGGGGR